MINIYVLHYIIGGKPYAVIVRAVSLDNAKALVAMNVCPDEEKKFVSLAAELIDNCQPFTIACGPLVMSSST